MDGILGFCFSVAILVVIAASISVTLAVYFEKRACEEMNNTFRCVMTFVPHTPGD